MSTKIEFIIHDPSIIKGLDICGKHMQEYLKQSKQSFDYAISDVAYGCMMDGLDSWLKTLGFKKIYDPKACCYEIIRIEKG